MRKIGWLVASALVVVAAAAGGGWWYLQGPGKGLGQAQAQTSGAGKTGDAARGADGKPLVPLEFLASEVTRLQRASLSQTVAFSGPLVAPATAVVRAKTGGRLLSLPVADPSMSEKMRDSVSLRLASCRARARTLANSSEGRM